MEISFCNYKYILIAAYQDGCIFAKHTIYLHYKGGVYVELGEDDDKTVLMALEHTLGYGKHDITDEVNPGDIHIVNTYDLGNSDYIALEKKGNKGTVLCECGCSGDCPDNTTDTQQYYICDNKSDLESHALWLSEI